MIKSDYPQELQVSDEATAGIINKEARDLITLHHDHHAVSQLHKGSIERFVPVTDEHYQDIRAMFLRVQVPKMSFT